MPEQPASNKKKEKRRKLQTTGIPVQAWGRLETKEPSLPAMSGAQYTCAPCTREKPVAYRTHQRNGPSKPHTTSKVSGRCPGKRQSQTNQPSDPHAPHTLLWHPLTRRTNILLAVAPLYRPAHAIQNTEPKTPPPRATYHIDDAVGVCPRPPHGQEGHRKLNGGVWRDQRRLSPRAVRKLGGHNQQPLAAHLHALHACTTAPTGGDPKQP